MPFGEIVFWAKSLNNYLDVSMKKIGALASPKVEIPLITKPNYWNDYFHFVPFFFLLFLWLLSKRSLNTKSVNSHTNPWIWGSVSCFSIYVIKYPSSSKDPRLEQEGGWSPRQESTVLPSRITWVNPFPFSPVPVSQVWLSLWQTLEPAFSVTAPLTETPENCRGRNSLGSGWEVLFQFEEIQDIEMEMSCSSWRCRVKIWEKVRDHKIG